MVALPATHVAWVRTWSRRPTRHTDPCGERVKHAAYRWPMLLDSSSGLQAHSGGGVGSKWALALGAETKTTSLSPDRW